MMYYLRQRLGLRIPNRMAGHTMQHYEDLCYMIDWRYALETGDKLLDTGWVYDYSGPTHTILVVTGSKSPEPMNGLVRDCFNHVCNTYKAVDESKFKRLVYSTAPITNSRRGEVMNLVSFANKQRGRR